MKQIGPTMTETWRDQMSPPESLIHCLSLRATTEESMLATTTRLTLRATTVASHDYTGADTAAFELVTSFNNLGSTYSGRVFFCLFSQGGLLPCATTLSLRVSMRSNKDEVPPPMAGKGQRPNRARARCLFTCEVQRRTFLPARNVFVVVLRQQRTYEGARAPSWEQAHQAPRYNSG